MTWRHTPFYCDNFLFILLRRGGFSRRREKSPEKVRPEGDSVSLREYPLPAPTGGRSGRGMALISRNGKGRGNAGVSGNGEVETECLCSENRLFFMAGARLGFCGGYYFSARGAGERSSIGKRKIRAGNVTQNITRLRPRGSGTGVSASVVRGARQARFKARYPRGWGDGRIIVSGK